MKETDIPGKDADIEAPLNSQSLVLTLVVLALGWVMIYADRLSISPLMNTIKSEFGLNFGTTSIVYSIYFASYIGFTIPITIAAAKFGYKKIMVIFFALAALSLAFAGILGFVFSLLIFFIALHGAGAGAFYPTAYTISTDIIPRSKRGFASSVINSGMAFGTMLGLVIAGPIILLLPNWQLMLLILAIPTLIVAYLFHRFVPNVSTLDSQKTHASALNNFKAAHYGQVLRNRNFVAIGGMMFCSLYGYWVILTWGPTFLQTQLNLGISPSGEATSVFAIIAIPSSILISRHSDRSGRKKIALAILPLSAATIFFMGYSSNLTEFLISTACYGIVGKLSLDPIALAWIQDVMPAELISPSLAMINVVAMSSSIFASSVTGIIADYTGHLSSGLFLGAAIVLFGAVFVVFAKNRLSIGSD
jgi:MFS family permease